MIGDAMEWQRHRKRRQAGPRGHSLIDQQRARAVETIGSGAQLGEVQAAVSRYGTARLTSAGSTSGSSSKIHACHLSSSVGQTVSANAARLGRRAAKKIKGPMMSATDPTNNWPTSPMRR